MYLNYRSFSLLFVFTVHKVIYFGIFQKACTYLFDKIEAVILIGKFLMGNFQNFAILKSPRDFVQIFYDFYYLIISFHSFLNNMHFQVQYFDFDFIFCHFYFRAEFYQFSTNFNGFFCKIEFLAITVNLHLQSISNFCLIFSFILSHLNLQAHSLDFYQYFMMDIYYSILLIFYSGLYSLRNLHDNHSN